MSLREQSKEHDAIASKALIKIVQEKSNKAEFEMEMQQLEEDIYSISISNSVRRSVREKLVEILPEIIKTVRNEKAGKGGVTAELVRTVQTIEDDVVRRKLTSILQKYRLMGR